MKEEVKVIKVLKEGMSFKYGECDHEWTYNQVANVCMTQPIKFITTRICNHCGRLEQTESNLIPRLMDNFEEIYNNFYK